MKVFKLFLFTIGFSLIFYACQVNQDNISELDSIIKTSEKSENIHYKNNVNVLELTDEIKEEFDYTDNSREVTNRIFEYGCVNNASTAVEIATAIFNSIYEMRDFDFPLEAYYDDENNYWLIRTSYPNDINLEGGRRYIIINASNAEIIMICSTL